MQRSGTFLKSALYSLLLFAAVIYGQDAHAIAIAESNANFDWSTYSVSGDFSYVDEYRTWYQAGYTTPNNGSFSPDPNERAHWDSFTENRVNPAGGEGYSYATANGNTYADMYAKDGTTAHGDIPGATYYGGSGAVHRGAVIQYTGATGGSLTFGMNYNLYQYIMVDRSNDLASVSTSFTIGLYETSLGNGNKWDYDGVALGVAVGGDWFGSGIYYDRGANDPYAETVNLANQLLTFTAENLVQDQYYFFSFDIDNSGFAINGLEGNEVPTPEPCTVALLGAGLAGLGFVRRKATRKL